MRCSRALGGATRRRPSLSPGLTPADPPLPALILVNLLDDGLRSRKLHRWALSTLRDPQVGKVMNSYPEDDDFP